MLWNVRFKIVKNLPVVDDIISFDDSDGTAIDAIKVFGKMLILIKIYN